MTPLEITLSPFLRLTLAGFGLEVKNHSNTFYLRLMRCHELVATARSVRSGGMTSAEALRKAQLNQWGPTSEFYQAVSLFADIAETLAQSKQTA